MKTAMQELYHQIEIDDNEFWNPSMIIDWLKENKEKYLEKEIKQLEQKYSDGYYLAKNEAISILEKNL